MSDAKRNKATELLKSLESLPENTPVFNQASCLRTAGISISKELADWKMVRSTAGELARQLMDQLQPVEVTDAEDGQVEVTDAEDGQADE